MNSQSDNTNSNGAERYQSLEVAHFPLGDNQVIAYSSLTRESALIQSNRFGLLAACKQPASLQEHANRIAAQIPGGAMQIAAVQQQLREFVKLGLLVRESDLSSRCSEGMDSQSKGATIATLGTPTKGRTESLQTCIESYAKCIKHFDRKIDILISDQSPDESTRNDNIAALRQIKSEYGVSIRYADNSERKAFVDAICRVADLPRDVVSFALYNEEQFQNKTGESRNALLLATAGDASFQADDDTLCRLAPAPEQQSGLRLTSNPDPTRFWFADQDEDIAALESRTELIDVFALHEQLIGRSVPECVTNADGQVSFEGAHATLVRKVDDFPTRVAITSSGLAGHSGMGSSVYMLRMDGGSRQNLFASEARYRRALLEHHLIRVVTRPTVCEEAFCMSFNLGLDHREILPPFMPIHRNQDGVFGALARSTMPTGLFGFIPWTVLHRPPNQRTKEADKLWINAGRLNSNDMIALLAHGFKATISQNDVSENLVKLGRVFGDYNRLAPADFEEVISLYAWTSATQMVERQLKMLQKFKGQPSYWVQDVMNYQQAVRGNVSRREKLLPQDLIDFAGEDQALVVLQKIVGRLGRLLEHWPAIRDAALQLRASGWQYGMNL